MKSKHIILFTFEFFLIQVIWIILIKSNLFKNATRSTQKLVGIESGTFMRIFQKVNVPVAFTKIGNLTGCYHIARQEVSWDDAQAACQATHPQAHLVSFDSREVCKL